MSEMSPYEIDELFERGFSRIEDREEGKKMWSIYTTEVNKYDENVAIALRDDANGVLVFTGLFSTIVAVFVLESYKKLSPDSGERTTVLLAQISQQLAGSQNNTYPLAPDSASFTPSCAILWVNALWFLSLVVSIMSAFYVMLVQQWTRRYTQMVQDLSGDHGHVRSSLFLATQKYQLPHAIGLIPLPLHIAVFLFLSGLIIFLFTVSRTIATVIVVCVGVFGLAYFVLTILPTIDDACPYFTPMSDFWWYLWHTSLSATALCLRWVACRLHNAFVRYNPGEVPRRRQYIFIKSLNIFENAIEKHNQRLEGGLRGNALLHARDAPGAVDLEAITWLLRRPAMSELSNIQDLVSGIPRATLIQFMSVPWDSDKITFLDHLFALLRSCAPGTVGLDDNTRKPRLFVCLDAIRHVVKASIVPSGVSISESLLNNLRINFANIGLMQALWADSDRSICVTARCICALLARNLLRMSWPEASELAWLQDVMGMPIDAIFNERHNLSAVDDMNAESFVYGVLSGQTEDLSHTQTASFIETLAIIMHPRSGSQILTPREIFEDQVSSLIRRLGQGSQEDRDNVLDKLQRIFPLAAEPQSQTPNT